MNFEHEGSLTDISNDELGLASRYVSENNVQLKNVVTVDACGIRSISPLLMPARYDLTFCFGPLCPFPFGCGQIKLLIGHIDIVKPGGFIRAAFVTMFTYLREVVEKNAA